MMGTKRKKHKKPFPFRRELTALAVILGILAVLFAAVQMLPKKSGTKPVDAPQATEYQSLRDTQSFTAAPEDPSRSVPESLPPAAGDKVVYLTFDDGPTENTTSILDVLDASGVKATFFVIHTYDGCEKQLREIYDRGHRIGLHSYSHKYEIYRSQESYFEDLAKISDFVYNATGYRSMLLRFPGGSSNTISRKYKQGIMSALTKAVEEKGYVYFDWDWDSMDASNLGKDAASITHYATRPIGQDDKIILLMHDSVTKRATVQALPEIIRKFKEAGYRFDVLSTDSYYYHHKVNN